MEDKINVKKFNGKNFHVWKAQIQAVLMAKDIYHVLSEERPIQDALMKAWDKSDRQAMAILLTSLDDRYVELVAHLSTSNLVWAKLNSVHNNKAQANKMVMLNEFYSLEMKSGERMQEYLTRAEHLSAQLKNVGAEVSESMLVCKIITGLSKEYRYFSSIWSTVEDSNHTLAYLEPKLIAEEQSQGRFEKNQGTALHTGTTDKGKRGGKKRSSKRRNKSGSSKDGKNDEGCFHCKEPGHWKRNCPQLNNSNDRKPESGGIFAEANNVSGSSEDWILDSGATEHMAFDKKVFSSYQVLQQPKQVRFGDEHQGSGLGVGDIQVEVKLDKGIARNLTLMNVLHVPELRRNLLSVSAATGKGSQGVIYSDRIVLRNAEGIDQLVAVKEGNLYKVNLKVKLSSACAATSVDVLTLWHERLGHINKRTIAKMSKEKSVIGLDNLPMPQKEGNGHVIDCDSCAFGKQARKSFPNSSRKRADEVGARLHVDLCTVGTESLGKAKYFVLFKDEYSNYRHIYCIKTKDEAYDSVRSCVAQIKSDTGKDVRCLVSDCGSELISKRTKEYLLQQKIGQELSAPFTPEQNGLIERDNRTVLEGTRTQLFHKNLPEKLWGESANTVVYLLNRSINKITGNQTPFERYFGMKPKNNHLRLFGCLAMMKLQEKKRSGYQKKLEARSKPMIMVGYARDFTYRLYDPNDDKIIITREAYFDESRVFENTNLHTNEYTGFFLG